MPLPVRSCCSNNQGRRRSLYIICVTIARVLGDYALANLIDSLKMFTTLNLVQASAVINARDGFAGISGVIGAILVDVYLNNYGMMFFASLLYGLGLACISWGFLSGSKEFTLPAVGIFMTGAGSLCLMNSSNALAKEEEDTDTDQRNSRTVADVIEFLFGNETHICKAHRYAISLSFIKYATKIMFIVASIVLGHIKGGGHQNYTKAVFYGQLVIPTGGLLFMSLISLVNIKSFVKSNESRCCTPLKHVISVCMTAFSKRHLRCPQNLAVEILYQGSPEHPLPHTNSLRFLEKAAIIDPSQPEEFKNKQRLCTLTEVEETKCLLRMVPMCMTFLLYGMVKSVGNTFFLEQGSWMDASLGTHNIKVPIQTLIIIGEISGLLTNGLYVVFISKRLSGTGRIYGSPIKYAIGIVLATFCCTIASWTEEDRGIVDSVFWLTPQFLLFGAMSEVTRDGIQGFFHEQLPPSIRRYDSVFTDAIVGVGALLCAVLSYATYSSIEHGHHLYIFYRLLTMVCFVILSSYTFVATRYQYQETKEAQSNQEE